MITTMRYQRTPVHKGHVARDSGAKNESSRRLLQPHNSWRISPGFHCCTLGLIFANASPCLPAAATQHLHAATVGTERSSAIPSSRHAGHAQGGAARVTTRSLSTGAEGTVEIQANGILIPSNRPHRRIEELERHIAMLESHITQLQNGDLGSSEVGFRRAVPAQSTAPDERDTAQAPGGDSSTFEVLHFAQNGDLTYMGPTSVPPRQIQPNALFSGEVRGSMGVKLTIRLSMAKPVPP